MKDKSSRVGDSEKVRVDTAMKTPSKKAPPGRTPPKKAAGAKARREERLRIMEKALIEGLRLDEVERAAPQQFSITPRQARADVQELLRRLFEDGDKARRREHNPPALALAIKRRERIYHEAVKHGDRRVALEAEKDRCRLLGVYPDDQPAAVEEDHDLDQAIRWELARLARDGQAAAAAPVAGDECQPDAKRGVA